MSEILALTGTRFGKLTVIAYDGKDKFGKHRWLCKCDCHGPNSIKSIEQGKLFRKDSTPTRSCGCLVKKHGASAESCKTPEYRTWSSMNERIKNPQNPSYKYYGEKGVKICERWNSTNPSGFANFLSDMGLRPTGKTIGRIDGNGNYEPGNCRWETAMEQASNRDSNRFITLDGKRMTVSNWAREKGLTPGTLLARLDSGWSPRDALETPSRKLDQSWRSVLLIEIDGKKLSIPEWSKVSGIPSATIRSRIKKGWDAKLAIFTPPQR